MIVDESDHCDQDFESYAIAQRFDFWKEKKLKCSRKIYSEVMTVVIYDVVISLIILSLSGLIFIYVEKKHILKINLLRS